MKVGSSLVEVKKATGVLEAYTEEKLRESLRRSGASLKLIDEVISTVRRRIYPEMPTAEIFKLSFKILKKRARHLAARYNLKRALLSLGPAGFPFEQFIARMFEKSGYQTSTNLFLAGKCVEHEVDISAINDTTTLLCECKFKNSQGMKVDLKTSLYVYARALDLNCVGRPDRDFILITNTGFTTEAIKYSKCMNLKIMGWSFPDGQSLRSQIEKHGMIPVTCLTGLKKSDFESLIREGYVDIEDFVKNRVPILKSRLGNRRIITALSEAERLLESLKV
ncbi:MAG: ATP-cone domain-containing protein [Deltaproteobacteria bacterium CG11_big_fil_rev_8_21_14_0_20_45_16]|nr:MAG: ATP-cone domain-containing protein [Deltaproteobacteria bacterium CG11_big_fil_rev_8_21_14_0_20_45_16]